MIKRNLLTGILLAFSLYGCGASAKNKVVISANEIHTIAVYEGQLINNYCIPKYKSAVTESDIEHADKICLPAKKSYYAVKFSWETLVSLIKNDNIDTTQLNDAILELSSNLNDLKQITKEME